MLPIDDVVTPESLDNSIVGTHKAAIYDGKPYGLSWISGCFGFEANPNVLKEAGLPEAKIPATWDEMLVAAQTVNEKGGKAVGLHTAGPARLLGRRHVPPGGVHAAESASRLNKPDDPFMPNFDDPKGFPVWEFVRKILPYHAARTGRSRLMRARSTPSCSPASRPCRWLARGT